MSEIEERFASKPPHRNSGPLREQFVELAAYLMKVLPAGRDKDMALDYLQTASMWAQSSLHGPEIEKVNDSAPVVKKAMKKPAKSKNPLN